MKKLKLGFLASHGGSNMQSIIDSCKRGKIAAEPVVIISNNSKSGAFERARKEGIPFYHISSVKFPEPEGLDSEIISVLSKHEADLVILAGYMKKIGSSIINQFRGRILNIHPALLPKFGGKGMYGKYVHEAVLKAGEKVSGPTVHVVDDKYDNGKILANIEVPVLQNDTVETLAARVLEKEHIIYPETIGRIANGEIKL